MDAKQRLWMTAAGFAALLSACHNDSPLTAGVGGPPQSKKVFATAATFTGDLLSAVPGAANGLAAGDVLCSTAAANAGLGGTWRVWLSSGSTSAISRIADVGP